MKRTLLIAFAISVLAACGAAPQKQVPDPQPAIKEQKTVNINPTLLEDCPLLKRVDETKDLTREDSLNVISDLTVAYSVCWHRHHDLSTVAKSAFNINASAPLAASAPAANQ